MKQRNNEKISKVCFGAILATLLFSPTVFAADSGGSGSDSLVQAVNKVTAAVNRVYDVLRDEFTLAEPISNQANLIATDKYQPAVTGNAANSLRLDMTNNCVFYNNRQTMLGDAGGSVDTSIACNYPTVSTFYNAIFPKELTVGSASGLGGDADTINRSNAENFLGDLEYSDSDASKVKTYIKYLESQGRGSVFNIDDQFKEVSGAMVPPNTYKLSFSPADPTGYSLFYGLNATAVNAVKNEVKGDGEYREELLSHRSQMVERSLFMDTLIRAYMRRVKPKSSSANEFPPNGKSVAKYEHDQVLKRISGNYYNAIKGASPATVSKETLLTLNQILLQLYEINQRSERMEVMQAVNNMPDLSTDSSDREDLLNIVFCAAAKKAMSVNPILNPTVKAQYETYCTGASLGTADTSTGG